MNLKNNKFAKIGYAGKEFYVLDYFEYKDEKYYYIMENFYQEGKDKIEDYTEAEIEVNFIYKTEDGEYATVDDDNLWKELMKQATKRIYLQQNQFFDGLYEN